MIKTIKLKKCSICTGQYKPFSSTSRVCSPTCAIEFNRQKDIKAKKKESNKARKDNALRKRVFYANDLKTRKAAAKKACHKYIRLRDYGKPCICCGRSLGDKYDAGHYLESGNNPQIRYDEANIHAQNVYCNQYQGGNSDDYRGNLITKIGITEVERLESMKGGIVKRTCEDYKEIELYYKEKLKQLTNHKEQR